MFKHLRGNSIWNLEQMKNIHEYSRDDLDTSASSKVLIFDAAILEID